VFGKEIGGCGGGEEIREPLFSIKLHKSNSMLIPPISSVSPYLLPKKVAKFDEFQL
jgi:hypothetical protein